MTSNENSGLPGIGVKEPCSKARHLQEPGVLRAEDGQHPENIRKIISIEDSSFKTSNV